MSCSKRRLTKQPYCEEDPKCYWDKRCKTRKNKPNGNSLAMSNTKKLDVILERLGNIERALETMNKTRKNTNNVNMNNNVVGLPSPIDEIDAEEDEENFNNTLNNNGNNNRNNNRNTIKNNNGNNSNNKSRKTANVPPQVLLNRAERNNNNSVKNGKNTASISPNALLRRVNNNGNKNNNKNNMSISPLSNNNK